LPLKYSFLCIFFSLF